MKKQLQSLKGKLYGALGRTDYEKKVEVYQELIAEEPENPRWYHKLGEVWARMGRTEEALEALLQAAQRYAHKGFLLKGIAVCKMILQLEPTHKETQGMLAQLYACKDSPECVEMPHPATARTAPARAQTTPAPSPSGATPAPVLTRSQEAPPLGMARDKPPIPSSHRPEASSPMPPTGVAQDEPRDIAEPRAVPEPRAESEPRTESEPRAESESRAESEPRSTKKPPQPREAPARKTPPPPPPPARARKTASPPPPPPQARAGAQQTPPPAPVEPPSASVEEDALELDFALPEWTKTVFVEKEKSQPLEVISLGEVLPGAQRMETMQEEGEMFEIPLEDAVDQLFDSLQQPDTSADDLLARLPPVPLFSSLKMETLRQLIEEVVLRQYEKGEAIVRQGEPGESLFVLVEGEAMVYHEGSPRVELNHLAEGAFFGEIALITDDPRSATVEALEECTALEISRDVLYNVASAHPQMLKTILRFFRERLISSLSETSELFSPFTGPERQELIRQFTFIEAEAEVELIRQGRPGRSFFVLLSGRAEVFFREGNKESHIADLTPGDLFGEMALIGEHPTTATVRTRSKCWLLRLDRERFQKKLFHHPQVRQFVQNIANQRQQEALEEETLSGERLSLV